MSCCGMCQYDVVRAEKHKFLLVTPGYEMGVLVAYEYVQDITFKQETETVKVGDKVVSFVILETLGDFLEFWESISYEEMFWWDKDGIQAWAIVVPGFIISEIEHE